VIGNHWQTSSSDNQRAKISRQKAWMFNVSTG
jgi:hypothetical protein